MAKELKKVSERDIRDRAGDKVFERGLTYFENEAVADALLISDTELFGHVVGRGIYKTKVMISKEGNLECQCSCPYEGTFCKHGVALLLYIISNEVKVPQESEIKNHLLRKSKEEIVSIIMYQAKENPRLLDKMISLEEEKHELKTFEEYKEKVGNVFRKRQFWDQNNIDFLVEDLNEILEGGKKLLEKGKVQSALGCYEAIASEIYENREDVYDDDGDLGSLFYDTLELKVGAFNASSLTKEEKTVKLRRWIEMTLWDENEGTGGGMDMLLKKIEFNDLRTLKEVLEMMLNNREAIGTSCSIFDASHSDYESSVFADAIQEVDLRQKDEVGFVRDAEAHFNYTFERLIDHYLENKDYVKAMDTAERALPIAKGFYKTNVLEKLSRAQKGMGRKGDAFANMLLAFKSRPSLESYRKLRALGDQKTWQIMRRETLKSMEDSTLSEVVLIDILALEEDISGLKAILSKLENKGQSYDRLFYESHLSRIAQVLSMQAPVSAAHAFKLLALNSLKRKERLAYRAAADHFLQALNLLEKSNSIDELEDLNRFIRNMLEEKRSCRTMQEEFKDVLGIDQI